MSGQLSEDSMFKALLNNKTPEQSAPPVKKEVSEKKASSSSEDAMFNVLLKNNPEKNKQSPPKTPVKTEVKTNIATTPTNTGSSEDAMFKALLNNNPGRNKQTTKPQEVKTNAATPTNTGSSEDAMYRALLNNKTPEKETEKKESMEAIRVKEPVGQEERPADKPLSTENIHQKEKPVVKITHTSTPAISEVNVDSIKELAASVEMMYKMMKMVIAPVLILILVVGIVTLFKA